VETDGRDTNRAGSSGVDNVVQFPRDWIGPLDDLVPIGTSTEGGGEDIADVFAADAFWSEGSASLHQVIEVAAPTGAAKPQAPVVPVAGSRLRRRPAPTRRLRQGGRPRHAGRLRVGGLGVAAASLLAVVAVVLEMSSPAPAARHHVALADGKQLRSAHGAGSGAANEGLRLSRLLVARAIEQASSKSSRVGHRSRVRRRVIPGKAAAGSSGEVASHLSVSYDVTQRTSPASSVAPPSEPSEGSAGSAVQSSTAPKQSSSSSPSGPVGQGAPFGPGQMTGG
jgi:hypothetical protein